MEIKYEKSSICFIAIILGLVVALSVQTYRLGSYRQQLELARTQSKEYAARQQNITRELESATVRLQSSNGRLEQCKVIIGTTNERLSESVSTISELREQIREVRESYEEMEKLLYSDDINNSDS